MQPETQYYKAVPVSEKMEKSNQLFCIDSYGFKSVRSNLYRPLAPIVTHYLQPIQLPDAQVLREALERIANREHEPGMTSAMYHNEAKRIAREALSAGDGSPIIDIFKWLLGYTDFPQRQEGEGQYYWRTHLREKLKAIGIEIENSPSPPIK